MKTVVELADIAIEAIGVIEKHTDQSGELVCILALMQNSLYSAIIDKTPKEADEGPEKIT